MGWEFMHRIMEAFTYGGLLYFIGLACLRFYVFFFYPPTTTQLSMDPEFLVAQYVCARDYGTAPTCAKNQPAHVSASHRIVDDSIYLPCRAQARLQIEHCRYSSWVSRRYLYVEVASPSHTPYVEPFTHSIRRRSPLSPLLFTYHTTTATPHDVKHS